MKSTILFALLTVVPLLGDDALYISPPQEREKAKATIESGHLVWRFPVVRAAVTDAVLRHDTEDKQILWLELHMAKYLDPGDHIYHFEPAPKNAEFYVRGSDPQGRLQVGHEVRRSRRR
jgi:hypothetical protein